MIATLRRRHRLAAFGLWLLVPAVVWLGSSRSAAPKMDVMPAGIEKLGPAPAAGSWGAADSATGIRLARKGETLWIDPGDLPRRPDVLVYWSNDAPAPGDGVPADARLVGRLDGNRAISLEAPEGSGGLLFFSLGHQERLHWLPLGASDE